MMRPHILLVDDEDIVLDVLEANLSDAGFRISRATTSDAALEIFDQDDVTLLMTDIRMPGPFNGIMLATQIREKKPELPVIFLSGNLDGLANSDRLAGPSAFLVKPVNVDDAINMINLLISRQNDPTEVIHNRAASNDRQITARPIGMPTSDRHAMETAQAWEDEDRPVRQPGSVA
jgi:DNA-binding NtrC family response regulator